MANKNWSVARLRRHARVRKNVSGTSECPRLNVFRSITAIYAQVVDDQVGRTLVSASSVDVELRKKLKGLNKTELNAIEGIDSKHNNIAVSMHDLQVYYDNKMSKAHASITNI